MIKYIALDSSIANEYLNIIKLKCLAAFSECGEFCGNDPDVVIRFTHDDITIGFNNAIIRINNIILGDRVNLINNYVIYRYRFVVLNTSIILCTTNDNFIDDILISIFDNDDGELDIRSIFKLFYQKHNNIIVPCVRGTGYVSCYPTFELAQLHMLTPVISGSSRIMKYEFADYGDFVRLRSYDGKILTESINEVNSFNGLCICEWSNKIIMPIYHKSMSILRYYFTNISDIYKLCEKLPGIK